MAIAGYASGCGYAKKSSRRISVPLQVRIYPGSLADSSFASVVVQDEVCERYELLPVAFGEALHSIGRVKLPPDALTRLAAKANLAGFERAEGPAWNWLAVVGFHGKSFHWHPFAGVKLDQLAGRSLR